MTTGHVDDEGVTVGRRDEVLLGAVAVLDIPVVMAVPTEDVEFKDDGGGPGVPSGVVTVSDVLVKGDEEDVEP